jgi:hypothetical protein
MSTLSPPIIDRFTAECALVWGYGDPYKVFDLRRGVPQYTFGDGFFLVCFFFQTHILLFLYVPVYFFPNSPTNDDRDCPITERGEGSRSSSSPPLRGRVDSNSDLLRDKIPNALTRSATEEATNTMLIYAVLFHSFPDNCERIVCVYLGDEKKNHFV